MEGDPRLRKSLAVAVGAAIGRFGLAGEIFDSLFSSSNFWTVQVYSQMR